MRDSKYNKSHYQKNKEYYRIWAKEYQRRNRDAVRNTRLIRDYGITLEDYNKLMIEQNGCCAICGTHQLELKRKLSVDHDHTTGTIRALLCIHCNMAIGYLRDDPELAIKACKYLETHKKL